MQRLRIAVLAILLLTFAGAASARLTDQPEFLEELKKDPPPGTYWDDELGVLVFDPPLPIKMPEDMGLSFGDPAIWFDNEEFYYAVFTADNYFVATKMPTPVCGSGKFQLTAVLLGCYNTYGSSPQPGKVFIYDHSTLSECYHVSQNPLGDRISEGYVAMREFVGNPFNHEMNEFDWTVVPFDDVPDDPVLISESQFWVAWDYRPYAGPGAWYGVGGHRPDLLPVQFRNKFFEGSSDPCPTIFGDWDYGVWLIRVSGYCRALIDIKPQSCPNPINPDDIGLVSVAIVGTADLDVTDIDPGTAYLNGIEPERWDFEDVASPFSGELCDCHEGGPDGFEDLVFKFITHDVYITLGDVEDNEQVQVTMTWDLNDGTVMGGSDCFLVRLKNNDIPGGGSGGQDSYVGGEGIERGNNGFQSTLALGSSEQSFALYPNSPNPFRDATKICFSLSDRANVELTVHDASGRRVAVLVDQELEPGIHTFDWHTDAPSGMYFCRLRAGERTTARRMVIVR